MAKKNYAAICNSIIAVCGGENNISRISHCMTRLRVQLLDGSRLNREEARKIAGVLNLVVQNGEYQFQICMQNLLNMRGLRLEEKLQTPLH